MNCENLHLFSLRFLDAVIALKNHGFKASCIIGYCPSGGVFLHFKFCGRQTVHVQHVTTGEQYECSTKLGCEQLDIDREVTHSLTFINNLHFLILLVSKN
jgi:hypothetical protein